MVKTRRKQHILPRADYGGRDIQVESELQAETNSTVPAKKPRLQVKKGLNILGQAARTLLVVAVIVALFGGIVYMLKGRHTNPIPADIRKSTSFSLYYPTKIPSGYVFDKSSIKSAQGTISYTMKADGNGDKVITVTQQAEPKNFDPKTMFAHSSLPTTVSPLGTIYDLSYKDQSRFMINTPDSLIFVSGSKTKITNEQLQQIVNGLKQSK